MTKSTLRSELTEHVATAVDILGPIAERDVPLAPLTTYRVGGSTAVMARPRERRRSPPRPPTR